MLLEIVGSFVAGLLFDILPTINMSSVADRDPNTASVSSFGATLQDYAKIGVVSMFVGHGGLLQNILCAFALACGVGLMTYILVDRKRRLYEEE